MSAGAEGVGAGNRMSATGEPMPYVRSHGQMGDSSTSITSEVKDRYPQYNALLGSDNPAMYTDGLDYTHFGSQYTTWEFDFLNTMVLGAAIPPLINSRLQTPSEETCSLAVSANRGNAICESNKMNADYSGVDSVSDVFTQRSLPHSVPLTFSNAAESTLLASSSNETRTIPAASVDGAPNAATFGSIPEFSPFLRIKLKQDKSSPSVLGKRQRDTAAVYETVKEPYPYAAGFHRMLSAVKGQLHTDKLVRIAKSLGEIRPSLMACTKDLTREDMVFTEQCFQRTLFEFNDFLQRCSAPTIACRRSGEVAAVNDAFVALTGWSEAVLLGREPNRNGNVRATSRGSYIDGENGSSRTYVPVQQAEGTTQQPVFLAELMDDDSVVQFYCDFARLAFEDSRGKVRRICSLIQYRSHDGVEGNDSLLRADGRTGIDGECSVARYEPNGIVSCSFCWTIKRDLFDLPMLIVMNVSNAAVIGVAQQMRRVTNHSFSFCRDSIGTMVYICLQHSTYMPCKGDGLHDTLKSFDVGARSGDRVNRLSRKLNFDDSGARHLTYPYRTNLRNSFRLEVFNRRVTCEVRLRNNAPETIRHTGQRQ